MWTNEDRTVRYKPGDPEWNLFWKLVYSMERVPMHDYDSDQWVLKIPGHETTADMTLYESPLDCVDLRNYRLVLPTYRLPKDVI